MLLTDKRYERSHQIDAVNFMLMRETGQLTENMKYWLQEGNNNGEPMYVNPSASSVP